MPKKSGKKAIGAQSALSAISRTPTEAPNEWRPIEDHKVKTLGDFRTWLADWIRVYNRFHEVLCTSYAPSIFKACLNDPFQDTGKRIAQAHTFAREFGIDVRPQWHEDVTLQNAVQALRAILDASDPCWHNADFTRVRWYGKLFSFTLGNQSRAIQALWQEREAGHSPACLHETSIGHLIDSNAPKFRMLTTFRDHEARGWMLDGRDGIWTLIEH